jgi:glutamate dehydrogenase (NAD(P)+)
MNTRILQQMEEVSGRKIDPSEKEKILQGPDEVSLVYSGLEETMISATHEIFDCWKNNPTIPDLRTATYVVAINKVANSYAQLGIFP